jgi:dCMP deaminase
MKVIEYSCYKHIKKGKSSNKDDVYFKIIETIATLSKDKNTQVGALILDVKGKVVSMGYNGCPSKFGVYQHTNDSCVPYTRDKQEIKLSNTYDFLGIDNQKKHKYNKYPFMLHAEQNALLTASDLNRLVGATIYCTHYPCTVCANMIAQVGIKSIKVMDNRHGLFEDTIVPTLFVYENMGIDLFVYKKEEKNENN